MAIFGLKPWVNPFGKMSIFRLFKLLVFRAYESVFFALEYRQRHFPGLYSIKKRLEKWQLLDQNHELTPLEKCQFIDFLKFVFLWPRKAFFCSRISSDTFSCSILPKKKSWKNGHFWTKTMG